MAGPRQLVRYALAGGNGAPRGTCFVDADSDALGLRLNSITNIAGSTDTPTNTLNMLLPVLNGRKGNLARARVVLVRYTGALPPGRKGALVWCPVFRLSTFTAWPLKSTGTHKGLPVVLVRKVDGKPDVLGR